jgi:hypothetical protein
MPCDEIYRRVLAVLGVDSQSEVPQTGNNKLIVMIITILLLILINLMVIIAVSNN